MSINSRVVGGSSDIDIETVENIINNNNTASSINNEIIKNSLPTIPENGGGKTITSEQFEEQIRKDKGKLSEHERIKFLAVRVCEDSPATFQQSIRKLAEQIIEYAQKHDKSAEYKDVILRYIVDAIALLPFKQNAYAVVLGLVLNKSKETYAEIIKRLTEQLQKSLDSGERLKAKNILVFYGELMRIGVVNCYKYIELLSSFLEETRAGTSIPASSQQTRQYYLSLIIESLASVHDSLKAKIPSECDALIKEISEGMDARDLAYLGVFKSIPDAARDIDSLSVLWNLLKKQQHQSESSEESFEGVTLASVHLLFEADLKNIEQPEFSVALDLKSNRDISKCVYIPPLFISALLKTEEESEEIKANEEAAEEQENRDLQHEDISEEDEEQQTHRKRKAAAAAGLGGPRIVHRLTYRLKLQSMVIRENVSQILELFSESKKHLLMQVQTLQRVMFFGQPNEFFGILIDLLVSKSVFASDKVLVNSSLANTLLASKREISNITIASVYAEYSERIGELAADTIEAFAEFLSHVISENHLEFAWESVEASLAKNKSNETVETSPLNVLWQDVVFRLCSLCGRDKVNSGIAKALRLEGEQQLQSVLLQFITPQSSKSVILLQYQQTDLAKQLMEKLVQKKSSDEINTIIETAINDESSDSIEIVLQTFLECLFLRSCETFTHLKILYDRYSKLLESLQSKHAALFESSLVHELLHFWQNSSFHLQFYLKKFIANGFLNVQKIAEAVLVNIAAEDEEQSDKRIHMLWVCLRRITQDISQQQRNCEVDAATKTEEKGGDEKGGELTAAKAERLRWAKEQKDRLLTFLFTAFGQIFQDNTHTPQHLEDRKYSENFVHFFRKYHQYVQWQENFASTFADVTALPQAALKAF